MTERKEPLRYAGRQTVTDGEREGDKGRKWPGTDGGEEGVTAERIKKEKK